MKQPQNGLLELRQGCRCSDNATTEPQSDAQTEAPAVGNHDEFLDLIDKPFAALAVTVKGVMDFLDVAPDQRELGLDRVTSGAAIRGAACVTSIPALGRVFRCSGHLLRPTILIPRGPKLSVLVSPPICKQHSPVLRPR